MRAFARSLRKLVFGETWTIPLGVATALATAELMRAALPDAVWTTAGGFGLVAVIVGALAWSLRGRP